MSLYDRVAEYPLWIEDATCSRQSRQTAGGFERHTTTVTLRGDDDVGRGEDVSYEPADHDTHAETGPLSLEGEYTLREFATTLTERDLFCAQEPVASASRTYRRWAYESAGLDLALRQAGESLATALDGRYDPLRFVVSTRLPDGDPQRVIALQERYPHTEFKLDPTQAWDDQTIRALAATDAVRILDLKGQYDDVDIGQPADEWLYGQLLDAFPDAIIEDPAVTPPVEDLVRSVRDRLAWDAPISGVEAIEAMPVDPAYLNVKPSRLGSLETLLETIEYCRENGLRCYGGGQYELDVGRRHAQAFASIFYPDAPNDLAPMAYNDPGVPDDAPTSPLPAPDASPGLPR